VLAVVRRNIAGCLDNFIQYLKTRLDTPGPDKSGTLAILRKKEEDSLLGDTISM
jgi:hypothetical protein